MSVVCSFQEYPLFDLELDVVLCFMHWAANVFKLGTDLISGKKLKKAKSMQAVVVEGGAAAAVGNAAAKVAKGRQQRPVPVLMI